jgi:hypothetical protein
MTGSLPTPSTARLHRLVAGPGLIVVLLAAHVLLQLLLFSRVAHRPMTGDEAAYADGARALSNLLRDWAAFGPVHSAELQRSVVGSGWFMPGMSVVLTPLFLVAPDAGTMLIRAYLAVFTTLLLTVTVRVTRRSFGQLYAVALLVFPGLVPMWVLFSFSAWGDLSAGLMVAILLALLLEGARTMRAGVAPSPADGLRIGLVAIAVLYLRSSALPLVGGFFVVALVAMLLMLRGRPRVRGVAALALAAAVFVALLLPWSVSASRTLDYRVITTTSVPMSLANAFGDRDEICFGPCDPGSSIWFSPLRYSREVARATGRSEVEVQQEMSAYATSGLTAKPYADDVLQDLDRYLTDPAHYEEALRPPGSSADDVSHVIVGSTNLLYLPLMLCAALMMVVVTRRSYDLQVISLLLKLSGAAFLIQPFVHVCSARYWQSFAPVYGLSAALLIQIAAAMLTSERAGTSTRQASTRILTVAQAAVGVLFVGVMVGLVVVAGS